jgi:hypothetical protein
MNKKTIANVPIYIIILLILFFSYASYTTVNGYFLTEQLDFFSTKTESLAYYQDDTMYGFEGINFSFTLWMKTVTKSTDGFIVGNPFDMNITGIITYDGENTPQKNNITVILRFLPPQPLDKEGNYISGLKLIAIQESNESNRFLFFSQLNDLFYFVSGPKDFKPEVYHNYPGGAPGLKESNFLDVDPAYTFTQLKLTKAVVILTYWVVFFSIIMALGEIKKIYNGITKTNDKKSLPIINETAIKKHSQKDQSMEEEEIQHLKHMESAIIPILVALAIFGLTLWTNVQDSLSITLISYLFGFSFILSLLHLKNLILKDLRGRIVIFFIDAVFLVILPIASVAIIILYSIFGIINILNSSLTQLVIFLIVTLTGAYISIRLVNKKIIPAFENTIFPILCKKYKVPKYKYRTRQK